MFYDMFVKLCKVKGVSRTKACIDCGISRTAWHKWQNGAIPNGKTFNKIAEYFGVASGQLLDSESELPTPRNNYNTILIAGRDGSYREKKLSDEDLAALSVLLDRLPDASDDL